MDLTFDREARKFLLLLIFADICFILLHGANGMHLISNRLFSIQKDFGFPEMYQYIKESWIVVLLLMTAINTSQVIYYAWSSLFMYFLLDDSLQIHERLGDYLANYFELQPMFNLRALDFGELIVSMFFGFLIFSFIGLTYMFSDRIAKERSKHLFILVLFVAFFGIVVDMLHIAIPFVTPLWTLIEDGGEMIIMSIIVCYVFELKSEPDGSPRI